MDLSLGLINSSGVIYHQSGRGSTNQLILIIRVVKTKEPTTPPPPSGLDDVLKMALGKFKDANVVSDDEDDECVDSDEWSSDED